MKTEKEMQDFMSGKDEVELTDQLIDELVKSKLWGTEEDLKTLRFMGAKWNKKRNTIVIDYKL